MHGQFTQNATEYISVKSKAVRSDGGFKSLLERVF